MRSSPFDQFLVAYNGRSTGKLEQVLLFFLNGHMNKRYGI